MKPTPAYNFPVTIINKAYEADPAYSELYKNIYDVILNFTIRIAFVPFFERTFSNWPPNLPENEVIPTNRQQALLNSATSPAYSITPDLKRSGQVETIKQNFFEDKDAEAKELISHVFFVSPQQYNGFERELKEIESDFTSIYSYKQASELESYDFLNFLLSNVISPQFFSRYELELLGRGNKNLTES